MKSLFSISVLTIPESQKIFGAQSVKISDGVRKASTIRWQNTHCYREPNLLPSSGRKSFQWLQEQGASAL